MNTQEMKSCERCWLLVGDWHEDLFKAKMIYMGEGEPSSIKFNYNQALELEEKTGNLLGFLHSHPGMTAVPSAIDDRTMKAWCACFGKKLLCAIEGVDGLRGWWYEDDESEPIEFPILKASNFLVGYYFSEKEAYNAI